MSAIITVTFNPALDKSTSMASLIPDKKLKCTKPVCEPGGGGINVARAIKKLGGDAIAVYLAGGCNGERINELLTGEKIKQVVIDTAESTRENLIVEDTCTHKQYLFDMPGPTVSEKEWQNCLNAIDNIQDAAYIIASGSIPQGVPTDIFAKLALIARKKNARFIVDTADEALKHALKAGVYLIKPNLRELGLLVGREDIGVESIGAAAKQIINKWNCEVVVVSMGEFGALLVTKTFELPIMPPKVKMESTVGAGDSMVAGIVLGLAANKTLTEAVRYGVACGTAATMQTGTELCSKTNADHLYAIMQNEASFVN